MRVAVALGLALLLLIVESVLVRYGGFEVTRIDVTVALVVFLAMRAALLEGAVGAFAIGYLLDVMSGRPTGLFVFLAVLMFLGARLVGTLVEARSAGSFALLVAGTDLVHGLLAVLFTALTSVESMAIGRTLSGLPWQVLLTSGVAIVLWPLLKRFEPVERKDTGLLMR